MKRAVVTGASGFVGGHITAALLARGWAVMALDRQFDANWQSQLMGQITCLETDVADLPAMGADAFIHAAALTASPEEAGHTPEANFRANIEPLLAALEWARQNCAGRTICISSSAVYRETQPGSVTEALPTNPLGLYAVAKQTLESLVATLRTEYHRDVVALRLSNIYGPREQSRPTRPRVSLVGRMVHDVLHTGRLTVYRDSPARDWTFASDIGQVVALLLDAPTLHHALYNAASGQVLTPMEIATVLQREIPDLQLDIRDGNDPAALPLTRRGYLDSARLEQETGFKGWTPFAAGLKQALAAESQPEISS